MSDRENKENLLARWSRRKREARVGLDDVSSDAATATKASQVPVSGDEQPSFDPASLPPLEGIDDKTDLRGFLAQGVPAELTRAALRRGWSSDPAIRDFVGLSENAWDFNAPAGVPGFGSLSMDDVQRLAQAFEKLGTAGDSEPISAPPVPAEAQTPTVDAPSAPQPVQAETGDQDKPPSELAAQPPAQGPNPDPPSRRRHGGARPRIET